MKNEVKGLIAKQRIPRDRTDYPPGWPHIPIPHIGVFAKCPKCGRITSLRICYTCKEIMCYECLTEHTLLHTKEGE